MAGKNPFEDALKNFKPQRKFVEEEKKGDSPGNRSFVENSEITTNIPADQKSEQEMAEDEALFSELVQLLALKKSDRAFYKIGKLITDSRKHNVAFDVGRFLDWRTKESDNPRVKEIVDLVLKRGFVGETVSWLISTTPEGMKYGNGSKELRLENARKSAKAAGVSLEEIAMQHNLPI